MEYQYVSFLDKLKSIYSDIQGLHHFKKNDTSFFKARHLGAELKTLCPDSANFKLDIDLLKKYNAKCTEQEKESILEEFKKELLYDLDILIKSREHAPVIPVTE